MVPSGPAVLGWTLAVFVFRTPGGKTFRLVYPSLRMQSFHRYCHPPARAALISLGLALAAVGADGCTGARQAPSRVAAVAEQEWSRLVRVESHVLGGLAWLDRNQVRERVGLGSPLNDSSERGDGCRQTVRHALPGGGSFELHAPPGMSIRNEVGSWASEIHFLPMRAFLGGRSLIAIPDSNLYTTASVLHSLFLFDDTSLDPQERRVTQMRRLALANLAQYRRAAGYSFWQLRPGHEGQAPRRGPLNVPIPVARAMAEVRRQRDFQSFRDALRRQGAVVGQLPLAPLPFWVVVGLLQTNRTLLPPVAWIDACLDPHENPAGADALFNLPNDTDDTAIMAVIEHLAERSGDGPRATGVTLEILARYRDLDRRREDGRDAWKGRGSGAYLTWLKDESEPTFARPLTGVMPLRVNNVDAVVNANAVYALGLTERTDIPGYDAAVRVVARCALEGRWPEAGLYYPQQMMFPYVATRAWREGRATGPAMDAGMRRLLRELLDRQERHGLWNPPRRGAFPGGIDRSEGLSTALGLSALLNLGEETARAVGEDDRYRRAIRGAVDRLLADGRQDRDGNDRDDGREPTPTPMKWDAGLIFSASFRDLAQWRSEAFATAAAVEALAKYALGYERTARSAGRSLRLIKGRGNQVRLTIADGAGRG